MSIQYQHELIGRIKNIKLSHRNWNSAKSELMAALLAAQPGEVICLTGPSRVGKSRLVKEVCNLMYPNIDDAFIPVLNLEIHNMASNGRFTSRTFYSEALNKVGHPFYAEQGLNAEEAALALRRRELAKESTLQAALEQSLAARGVMVLILDEVQHLLYSIGGEKGAAGMLDSWKCLAEKQKLIFVLVGAYPILEVLNLSPHMVGRTITVHLPRYKPVEEDIKAFKAILMALSEIVPTEGDEGLCKWTQTLYEGSLGCIGLLSKWLRTAASQLAVSSGSNITESGLSRAMPPRSQLEAMLKEIQTGEEVIDAYIGKERP